MCSAAAAVAATEPVGFGSVWVCVLRDTYLIQIYKPIILKIEN